MRISIVAAAVIAAPVLLLTACGAPTHATSVKGTVIGKEYEPAKTKKKLVPVTSSSCTTKKAKGKTKRVCATATTGHKTVNVLARKECYELDIRLANGNETEVCDRDAYYALSVHDTYSSTKDYSKKVR